MHHTAKMAVINRVSNPELSTEKPFTALETLDNGPFICNSSDHIKQRSNYVTLVARILTQNIKCLEDLEDVVTWHMPHKYSKEMNCKSENVRYLKIV